jgi:quercetin dioxygenase-like cupin family protein
MSWEEAKTWLQGNDSAPYYQNTLDDANERPSRNAQTRRRVRPSEMPWEMAPQGILKHMMNVEMNTRMETIDAYMQIIPPDSKSGKHRHLAEECLYVLEGHGYDLHTDCDIEITDSYNWVPQKEEKKFEWKAGDVIYVPPNTIHQHFNSSKTNPARLISAINRIYKYSGLNDLQQIENAPEYVKGVILDSAKVKEIVQKARKKILMAEPVSK